MDGHGRHGVANVHDTDRVEVTRSRRVDTPNGFLEAEPDTLVGDGEATRAVREGDSIAVSTQGLQITPFSRSARTSSALKPARLVNTVSVCSPMSGARVGANGESDRRTGQPITENRPRVGWSMS